MIRLLLILTACCLAVKCHSDYPERRARHHSKYFYPDGSINLTLEREDSSRQYDCKKRALWKCGHSMMKASNFLNHHLSKDEAVFHKCSTRNAFFNCLKKNEPKYCNKNGLKKYRSAKEPSSLFKQRLVKTLWKSKNCLLTPTLFRFNKFRLRSRHKSSGSSSGYS